MRSISAARGYVGIVFATVLWGTMGVLAKFCFQYGILPETLIALRLIVSFVTLLVVLLVFDRRLIRVRRTDAFLIVVLGVFGVALQRVAFFYAVDLTSATIAALLFYTYPVFVTLSAAVFLKERVGFWILPAIVLTFSGAAMVVRAYDVSSLRASYAGIMAGLLSSLFFVLYFFLARKLRSDYTNFTLTLYGEGVGALLLAPLVSVSFSQVVSFPWQLWLLIVVIAWFPSLLAYLLYSYSLKYVKASKGSILGVIEPLSAAVFSMVFIGERLEMLQVVGMTLALMGVVLLFRVGRA